MTFLILNREADSWLISTGTSSIVKACGTLNSFLTLTGIGLLRLAKGAVETGLEFIGVLALDSSFSSWMMLRCWKCCCCCW